MNPFDAEAPVVYDRGIDAGRRDSLAVLLELVPHGAEVLDVGIGGGALGEYLSSVRGCRVDGATISPVEAARAAAHYRRIEVADLNVSALDTLFAGRRYDAIICADVLEHLPRPTAVLDSCRRLLADGGRLLLSIPNVAYSGLIAELLAGEFRYRGEGLLDRTHVRFFTRRSALRLLREQGWEVESVEPVCLDLRDSEFRPDFDLLPPAVRRHLLARPDGLTYQFIIRACPAAAGAAQVAGPADRPALEQLPSYSTQLYLGDASGYAEDRKLVVPARIGEQRQRVAFPLADPAALTAVRFDPADRPGFMHLFALRLLDAHGRAVWSWDGAAASLRAGDTHDVVFQTPWSAGGGVVLLLTGDDPYFELPLTAAQFAACGARATLEAELSWPMSPEYLLFVDELSRRGPREQALAAELERARESLARHEQELAAERARRQQQRAEAEAAAAALAAQQAVAGRLEAERARLLQEGGAREAQLRRATQEIASLSHALRHARARGEAVAAQREALLKRATDLEASRWSRLGARLARLLGRSGSPLLGSTASLLPPAPPRARRAPRARVSIVVPVYRGLDDTRTCLDSVLGSSARAPLRIVVVNDASPEPQIASYLRQLAERDPRVELVENRTNLGFVASANLGMQRHVDDDVILLNSDTEVAGDWVDRLREAAYRERGIATVTPFSNAATICSYPRFCVEGALPQDTSSAALDRYFAAENAGEAVEVPTAVGFCMFIRRDCLDEVGLFDAERFGRGYGEENDFCMRARATGWRHVLALDTFVHHRGGVSFGEEKAERVRQAQQTLAMLHPQYAAAVARHIAEDPARPARLKVDLARLRAGAVPMVLFVSHVGGGGTERHLRELAEALAARAGVLLLRPGGDETVLEWLREGEGFRLAFRLPDEYEALLQALRALGVAHVHFHHTRGHPPCVRGLPQSLGVAHDFTAHDFFSACPQVTLSDEIGRYCGEFGAEQCAACLKRRPAPGGAAIEAWRGEQGRLLGQARYVIAPSTDAAARLRRYFPSINVVHVPHLDVETVPATPMPQPLAGARPLRIVVMGALSQIKGADVFEATAALASQRGSRLEFHLVGYAYRDLRVVPGARLTVHGEYAE
ncbi:MAG: methyltransferase domain-containing protein, partial [Burkholderiaceae bacterium]|nr:methyltransferase domain-containing protein [Burkholderiaceae bacterium]